MAAIYGVFSVGSGPASPSAHAQTAHFSGALNLVDNTLSHPGGLTLDSSGYIYVADTENNRIIKETPSAGTYSQSLLPILGLSGPSGIVVDGTGNLYIADSYNDRVIKETLSDGGYIQSTVASDSLSRPAGVAIDTEGNVYIADTDHNRVVKETLLPGGYVESTIACGGSSGTTLNQPQGLVVDGSGNIFILDSGNNRILKEVPFHDTYTETVLVSGGLNGPQGISLDASGSLYIADRYNNRVVKETPSGNAYVQSTVAFADLFWPAAVAIDSIGNIYVADNNNNRVLQSQPNIDFKTVDVGSASHAVSLIFTFDTGGTPGKALVSMQGAAGLDFIDTGSGSCVTWHAYYPGDSCTVNVSFTPTLPGPRYGAAVLQDSSGNAMATGYAHGVGIGPQTSFSPAVQSTVTSGGLLNPRGLSADGNGNLYVADTDHNRVLKETSSGGAYSESTIASNGLLRPIGIAVDGAGNVYIGDCDHGRIVKETLSNGSYLESTVVSGISCSQAIALDGNGNMYIAEGGGSILLETASPGGYTQTTVLSSGIQDVDGIAIDASGNLYLADAGTNQIIKESLSGGLYTAGIVPTSGLNHPRQISLDASGNIFIADANNGRILKEAPISGSYVESEISSGLIEADSVIVDAAGNVYIADTYYRQVVKLDYAHVPSLGFPATSIGATSGAQNITLQNIGNGPLTFPAPVSGSNPAVSANFAVDASVANACPQAATGGSAGASLLPGASCVFSISFAPTATGSLQGNVIVGDTNLNAANALQAIALTGTGFTASTNFVLSVPTSAVYGNPVQVIASITAGLTNSPVLSGTVAFSDQNGSFGSKAVNGGSAAQSYLAPSVGSFTLSGAFSPSNADYIQSSGHAAIRITAAPLVVTAASRTRVYGTANPVLSGSITGLVNGDALLVNYTTAAQATNMVGQYPILVKVTGSTLGNYTLSTIPGVLTVQKAGTSTTLNLAGAPATDGTVQLQAHVVSATTGAPSGTVRFYNGKQLLGEATLQNGVAAYSTDQLSISSSNPLTAMYQGDSDFLDGSSDVLPVLVEGSSFWIEPVAATVAVAVHAGTPAAFSLNVGPGTAGTYPGIVNFTVTGLPEGATATFSPATLAADSGKQTVAMTVQTKAQAASAVAHMGDSWRHLKPFVGGSALALILLPLAGARRLRKAGMSMLLTLLLVLGGIASSTALIGCGVTRNTAWGNTADTQPTTYILTVIMTSGGVQHMATESLTLQP